MPPRSQDISPDFCNTGCICSDGGSAYSLPGTPDEAGEEQETHTAPLNTREMLAGFYVSSCEFEKEVAGVLNTKNSAFQEALLKRGFLIKKEGGAKRIVFHQLAKRGNLRPKSGP